MKATHNITHKTKLIKQEYLTIKLLFYILNSELGNSDLFTIIIFYFIFKRYIFVDQWHIWGIYFKIHLLKYFKLSISKKINYYPFDLWILPGFPYSPWLILRLVSKFLKYFFLTVTSKNTNEQCILMRRVLKHQFNPWFTYDIQTFIHIIHQWAEILLVTDTFTWILE